MYLVAFLVGFTYLCAGVNIGALIWGSSDAWPLNAMAMAVCLASGVYQTRCLIRIAQSMERIAQSEKRIAALGGVRTRY